MCRSEERKREWVVTGETEGEGEGEGGDQQRELVTELNREVSVGVGSLLE